MITTQQKKLADQLHVLGHETYRERSCSSHKINAQLNLCGRTHYVDDDTLRGFGSRILCADETASGLIFWIVESCFVDYEKTKRTFRFVAFDLFGTVLERADLQHGFSGKNPARKAFYAWIDQFDLGNHYSNVITQNAKRLEQQAAAYWEVLAKSDF